METVILKPVSKRAKQLIRQHGDCWSVIERRPVACFNGDVGILIESPDGTHSRWVLPGQVKESA